MPDFKEIFGGEGFDATRFSPEWTLKQWALYYASIGFSVFPCHSIQQNGKCSCQGAHDECRTKSPGKHPRTQRGFKDATKDTEQIEKWWGMWPESNIGIATGKVSGIMVVDVDPRNDGDASLGELFLINGIFPDTLTATTGGSGTHYYFKYRERFRMIKAPGIDFKTDGGYVIAPPSNHASGRHYKWFDVDTPTIDPPEWLGETAPANVTKIIAGPALEASDRPLTPQLIADLASALPAVPAEDYDQWIR